MPILTVFETSPDRGRGLARDMRVRWALEEVGQPYDVRLMSFEGLRQPDHLARNPFGQIPTYQDDDLTLFESGAIVLHIADTHEGLMPVDHDARARAVAWVFAAINTIEPPIFDRSMTLVLEGDRPWQAERLTMLEKRIRVRLGQLSTHLGDSDWLNGDFSAGDLMMATVLMRANASGLLTDYPNLAAYLSRAEARPAFQRAFVAQRAVFEATSSA